MVITKKEEVGLIRMLRETNNDMIELALAILTGRAVIMHEEENETILEYSVISDDAPMPLTIKITTEIIEK